MDDADAARREQLVLAQPERASDRGQYVLGQLQHDREPVHLAHQHRELVATEAGQRVLRPDAGAQPVGDAHQQLVADLVAEAVVDQLEPVQVEEQHRASARRVVLQPDQRRLEPAHEEDAVVQPGQPIVMRVVNQLRLDPPALGHLLLQRAGAVAQVAQQHLLVLLQRLQVLHVGGRAQPFDDPAGLVARRGGPGAVPEISAVRRAAHPELDVQDA